jgi:hypothetical protein
MIVDDAIKFLRKKPWILGHLVAAAYICNRVSSSEASCTDFETAVLAYQQYQCYGRREWAWSYSSHTFGPSPNLIRSYVYVLDGVAELTL